MRWKALKYTLPFLVYIGAYRSFDRMGLIAWLPVVFAFIVIPLSELLIAPNSRNMDAAEEAIAKEDPLYDYLIYIVAPLQYLVLIAFLRSIDNPLHNAWDKAAHIVVMGINCGVYGINVGHELGHRTSKFAQFLAKSLLLTSLYMHFFIEHNRGHHKNVATANDPATARYNEPLYTFFIRMQIGTYRSAWHIATKEQKAKGRSFWQNEMLQLQVLQIVFCAAIGLVFGWAVLGYFLLAALVGILLLQTVNYIEHYGLSRKATANGYERAQPYHSWNSDHVVGRLMLFELSRHSDHHYLASRKYQVLRHHDNSPQLPTGYPGSMILAAFPPLWFRVMNKRIKKAEEQFNNA